MRDNLHSLDVARFMVEFWGRRGPAEVYNLGGGKENSCSILEAFQLAESVTGYRMRYAATLAASLTSAGSASRFAFGRAGAATLLSQMATLASSERSRRTTASPIPELPPVTTATRPENL